MKNELLEEGDIFILGKGMTVYANIPEMFVYNNTPTSTALTKHNVEVDLLYEGEDIEKSFQIELQKAIKDICTTCHIRGLSIPDENIKYFIEKSAKYPKNLGNFIFKGGEFVVIKTTMDGGGRSHNDYYPDGHHVFCKRLKNGEFDENGDEVDFYQSGAFTATIIDVKPIRKLKLKFV